MKKWVIQSPDQNVITTLRSVSSLSTLCCTVLTAQGCSSIQAANERIGCQSLSSPFLLCDMQEAADCINRAIDEGKKICVFGDYDCDGIMATAILFSFLQETGADVIWKIPERHEGYGLTEEAVLEMHENGVELIVTVDNGISAVAEAERIAELGMELVITDHHQPGPMLPKATAVVDPHREDNFSPFRLYCGAGVALLLVAALNDGDTDMAMEQFGDLAAIATIGDVVSLTGENRFIVQMGLQYLENTERYGLRILRQISSKSIRPLNAGTVAFTIVPRINAAGRVRSPKLALELILSEDPQEARNLAETIQNLNTERQETEAEIIHAVMEYAEQNPQILYERVMVFSGKDWHTGVIGIVAARMEERFEKPCFMISVHDGVGHGSARSFGGFSVFDCLSSCASLLMKFGGHPAAGGFTIAEENIPAFREAVAAYAASHHPDMPFMELHAACNLPPEMLTVQEIESLSALEPFGEGQPEPLFFIENAHIRSVQDINGMHTKLFLDVKGKQLEAMLFRTSADQTDLRAGDVCHLMVLLSVNEYRGEKKVSLTVKDYRKSGFVQTKLLAAIQTYDKYRRGETLPTAFYKAILPSREECVVVYKAIPKQGIALKRLALSMYTKGMNYCKMRICLDAFCELGLLQFADGESRVIPVPAKGKVDLQNARVLNDIAGKVKMQI